MLLLLLLMITRSLAHHSTLRRSLSKSSSIAIENQSLHRLMRRTTIYAHPPGFHFNYEKQLITPIRDLLFSFLLSLFFFFWLSEAMARINPIQTARHDTHSASSLCYVLLFHKLFGRVRVLHCTARTPLSWSSSSSSSSLAQLINCVVLSLLALRALN